MVPYSNVKSGVVTWEFPARGDKPPVTLKYYLGESIAFPRPKHLEEGNECNFDGSGLVRENASILAGSWSGGARIIPDAATQDTPKPPAKAFRRKGRHHYENFTLACKGEDTATSPFEYAGPLSEFIVLGDIALQHPGKNLQWDAEHTKISNDEAADDSLFMRRLALRDHMNWY